MGFLKRLFGLGAAAGTAYAAVKVAQKYEDNKAAAVENGDDVASDAAGVVKELGKAASDVYTATAAKVKTAADNAGIDTERLGSTFKEAGKAVGDAGKVVAGKVKDSAGDYYAQAKDFVADAIDSAKGAVGDVVDSAKSMVYTRAGSCGEEPKAEGSECECGCCGEGAEAAEAAEVEQAEKTEGCACGCCGEAEGEKTEE